MQEAVGNLDRLLESFAVEIEAFLNGGPRLREKHLKEAEEAGLDPDGLANLADAWGNALAKREKAEAAPPLVPEAEPRLARRRFRSPEPAQNVAPNVGPSEIGEAQKVFGKADFAEQLEEAIEEGEEPKAEAQPEPEAEAVPGSIVSATAKLTAAPELLKRCANG